MSTKIYLKTTFDVLSVSQVARNLGEYFTSIYKMDSYLYEWYFHSMLPHIWTIIMHLGHRGINGMIFNECISIHCFKFWIRPATPGHWPYSPIFLWHAIVDEYVEVAPIYSCRGKVEKPTRSWGNFDLHIEWEAARLESHFKQPAVSKEFLYLDLDHWLLMHKSWEPCNTNGLV